MLGGYPCHHGMARPRDKVEEDEVGGTCGTNGGEEEPV
jgi:hypothetical protein